MRVRTVVATASIHAMQNKTRTHTPARRGYNRTHNLKVLLNLNANHVIINKSFGFGFINIKTIAIIIMFMTRTRFRQLSFWFRKHFDWINHTVCGISMNKLHLFKLNSIFVVKQMHRNAERNTQYSSNALKLHLFLRERILCWFNLLSFMHSKSTQRCCVLLTIFCIALIYKYKMQRSLVAHRTINASFPFHNAVNVQTHAFTIYFDFFFRWIRVCMPPNCEKENVDRFENSIY